MNRRDMTNIADGCTADADNPALPATAAAAVALALQGRLLGNQRRVELIYRALQATGDEELRRIEVLAYSSLIILRGRVSSNQVKEAARSAAESVPGPETIWNRLEVEVNGKPE